MASPREANREQNEATSHSDRNRTYSSTEQVAVVKSDGDTVNKEQPNKPDVDGNNVLTIDKFISVTCNGAQSMCSVRKNVEDGGLGQEETSWSKMAQIHVPSQEKASSLANPAKCSSMVRSDIGRVVIQNLDATDNMDLGDKCCYQVGENNAGFMKQTQMVCTQASAAAKIIPWWKNQADMLPTGNVVTWHNIVTIVRNLMKFMEAKQLKLSRENRWETLPTCPSKNKKKPAIRLVTTNLKASNMPGKFYLEPYTVLNKLLQAAVGKPCYVPHAFDIMMGAILKHMESKQVVPYCKKLRQSVHQIYFRHRKLLMQRYLKDTGVQRRICHGQRQGPDVQSVSLQVKGLPDTETGNEETSLLTTYKGDGGTMPDQTSQHRKCVIRELPLQTNTARKPSEKVLLTLGGEYVQKQEAAEVEKGSNQVYKQEEVQEKNVEHTHTKPVGVLCVMGSSSQKEDVHSLSEHGNAEAISIKGTIVCGTHMASCAVKSIEVSEQAHVEKRVHNMPVSQRVLTNSTTSEYQDADSNTNKTAPVLDSRIARSRTFSDHPMAMGTHHSDAPYFISDCQGEQQVQLPFVNARSSNNESQISIDTLNKGIREVAVCNKLAEIHSDETTIKCPVVSEVVTQSTRDKEMGLFPKSTNKSEDQDTSKSYQTIEHICTNPTDDEKSITKEVYDACTKNSCMSQDNSQFDENAHGPVSDLGKADCQEQRSVHLVEDVVISPIITEEQSSKSQEIKLGKNVPKSEPKEESCSRVAGEGQKEIVNEKKNKKREKYKLKQKSTSSYEYDPSYSGSDLETDERVPENSESLSESEASGSEGKQPILFRKQKQKQQRSPRRRLRSSKMLRSEEELDHSLMSDSLSDDGKEMKSRNSCKRKTKRVESTRSMVIDSDTSDIENRWEPRNKTKKDGPTVRLRRRSNETTNLMKQSGETTMYYDSDSSESNSNGEDGCYSDSKSQRQKLRSSKKRMCRTSVSNATQGISLKKESSVKKKSRIISESEDSSNEIIVKKKQKKTSKEKPMRPVRWTCKRGISYEETDSESTDIYDADGEHSAKAESGVRESGQSNQKSLGPIISEFDNERWKKVILVKVLARSLLSTIPPKLDVIKVESGREQNLESEFLYKSRCGVGRGGKRRKLSGDSSVRLMQGRNRETKITSCTGNRKMSDHLCRSRGIGRGGKQRKTLKDSWSAQNKSGMKYRRISSDKLEKLLKYRPCDSDFNQKSSARKEIAAATKTSISGGTGAQDVGKKMKAKKKQQKQTETSRKQLTRNCKGAGFYLDESESESTDQYDVDSGDGLVQKVANNRINTESKKRKRTHKAVKGERKGVVDDEELRYQSGTKRKCEKGTINVKKANAKPVAVVQGKIVKEKKICRKQSESSSNDGHMAGLSVLKTPQNNSEMSRGLKCTPGVNISPAHGNLIQTGGVFPQHFSDQAHNRLIQEGGYSPASNAAIQNNRYLQCSPLGNHHNKNYGQFYHRIQNAQSPQGGPGGYQGDANYKSPYTSAQEHQQSEPVTNYCNTNAYERHRNFAEQHDGNHLQGVARSGNMPYGPPEHSGMHGAHDNSERHHSQSNMMYRTYNGPRTPNMQNYQHDGSGGQGMQLAYVPSNNPGLQHIHNSLDDPVNDNMKYTTLDNSGTDTVNQAQGGSKGSHSRMDFDPVNAGIQNTPNHPGCSPISHQKTGFYPAMDNTRMRMYARFQQNRGGKFRTADTAGFVGNPRIPSFHGYPRGSSLANSSSSMNFTNATYGKGLQISSSFQGNMPQGMEVKPKYFPQPQLNSPSQNSLGPQGNVHTPQVMQIESKHRLQSALHHAGKVSKISHQACRKTVKVSLTKIASTVMQVLQRTGRVSIHMIKFFEKKSALKRKIGPKVRQRKTVKRKNVDNSTPGKDTVPTVSTNQNLLCGGTVYAAQQKSWQPQYGNVGYDKGQGCVKNSSWPSDGWNPTTQWSQEGPPQNTNQWSQETANWHYLQSRLAGHHSRGQVGIPDMHKMQTPQQGGQVGNPGDFKHLSMQGTSGQSQGHVQSHRGRATYKSESHARGYPQGGSVSTADAISCVAQGTMMTSQINNDDYGQGHTSEMPHLQSPSPYGTGSKQPSMDSYSPRGDSRFQASHGQPQGSPSSNAGAGGVMISPRMYSSHGMPDNDQGHPGDSKRNSRLKRLSDLPQSGSITNLDSFHGGEQQHPGYWKQLPGKQGSLESVPCSPSSTKEGSDGVPCEMKQSTSPCTSPSSVGSQSESQANQVEGGGGTKKESGSKWLHPPNSHSTARGLPKPSRSIIHEMIGKFGEPPGTTPATPNVPSPVQGMNRGQTPVSGHPGIHTGSHYGVHRQNSDPVSYVNRSPTQSPGYGMMGPPGCSPNQSKVRSYSSSESGSPAPTGYGSGPWPGQYGSHSPGGSSGTHSPASPSTPDRTGAPPPYSRMSPGNETLQRGSHYAGSRMLGSFPERVGTVRRESWPTSKSQNWGDVYPNSGAGQRAWFPNPASYNYPQPRMPAQSRWPAQMLESQSPAVLQQSKSGASISTAGVAKTVSVGSHTGVNKVTCTNAQIRQSEDSTEEDTHTMGSWIAASMGMNTCDNCGEVFQEESMYVLHQMNCTVTS